MNSYTVEPRAEFCNSVRGSCPIRLVIDSPIRVSAISEGSMYLSDDTAFMAGSPVTNSLRSPLAVVLSSDGKTFGTAFLLRSNESDPELIYEGKAKRKGFHYCKSAVYDGYLYVGYATNKEAVEISIVPEESLMLRENS